jgi:SAM-dependent methyltransferase
LKTDLELQAEMEAMGPWHHKVHLRDDLFTGSSIDTDATGQPVTYFDPERSFGLAIKNALPNGLEGRSFLDVACNAGGYCFSAKDHGASRTYGFDIRKHWIRHAKFIQDNRAADSTEMTFEVADLLNFGKEGDHFDIAWFSGIFYHLPDPVAALKLVADRTDELLFLNTACLALPEGVEEIPGMNIKLEGTEQLMSGTYQLSWLPSGPNVLKSILRWLGFPESRTYFWITPEQDHTAKHPLPGRIAIIAAREKGRLHDVPNIGGPTVVSGAKRVSNFGKLQSRDLTSK